MRIMEDVKEGCDVQPSSPGHAEQRSDEEKTPKESTTENGLPVEIKDENGREDVVSEPANPKLIEVPKEEEMSPENEVEIEEKTDKNSDSNHVNDEAFSDASSPEPQSNKRKHEGGGEDVAIKKLRLDLQENFASRDKILSEFMEISECSNIDQIQPQCDNIVTEIRMLNDVAKEKEREWNNVLHLKKLKEELLLRLQRRKQILILNDKSVTDPSWEAQMELGSGSSTRNNCSNQSILKANLSSPARARGDRTQNRTRNLQGRPQATAVDMNGTLDYRGVPKKAVVDVQRIIADYRQRHPEQVPRRGRRIRNNNSSDGSVKSNGVMNFSSLTLGSGAQVRQNTDINNELGLILSAFEMSRQEGGRVVGADSTQLSDSSSFRDMLVNLSRLSQSERNELFQNVVKPPPPYPEVTVHPVLPATTSSTSSPSNSLLHGILTKSPAKSSNGSKSSFSPTLARLLTAPERGASQSSTTISSTVVHPGNVSISEILASSKAGSEITITAVSGNPYENAACKARSGQIDEEEAEDSADRLVIDESTEGPDGRRGGDNGSDVGDEVPQCQGCNQKAAQFVCAGCSSQWYCSRDCQVSAWDMHSENCSG